MKAGTMEAVTQTRLRYSIPVPSEESDMSETESESLESDSSDF